MLCQALGIISNPLVNSNWSYRQETNILGLNCPFFVPCERYKFNRWPWKTIAHLFYILPQALCIISQPSVNSNWSYSPETPNSVINVPFRVKIVYFLPRVTLKFDGWPWKKNRAPTPHQVCASFHCHMWIQTGVMVRKWLNWVLTSVTLTFDLWPWPFAWTSLWSLVITLENFMMIQWWEHSEKNVTDGQKIPFKELLGRS